MQPNIAQLTPVIAPAAQIAEHPWQELPGADRANYKPLWRSDKSIAGLMRVWPGGIVPAHSHKRAHHHIWVVQGSADILYNRLEAGSYVHIPAGVEHSLIAGPDGCTLFYLYLQ